MNLITGDITTSHASIGNFVHDDIVNKLNLNRKQLIVMQSKFFKEF